MRQRTVIAVICTFLSRWPVTATAQITRPESGIFLAPLSIQNGRPVIGKPVKLTNDHSYDNQQTFTPDGRAILFSASRENTRSDVYRYDIATKAMARVTPVTATPDIKASATIMPGGTRFSVIRIEREVVRIGERRKPHGWTRQLWTFALDGSDAKPLLPSVNNVLSHAWIDASNLVLVVPGNPNVLMHADLRTGTLDTLGRGVGNSLLPLRDHSGFAFPQAADSTLVLTAMRWPARTAREIVAVPPRVVDMVWAANDVVLASSNSKLLYWHAGMNAWAEAGDFTEAGLGYITTLSVSPDGQWLAIAALEVPCPTGARFTFDAFARPEPDYEIVKSFHMPQYCLFPDGP